jgi:diguanylate cyclase (GGDEF)-like protein
MKDSHEKKDVLVVGELAAAPGIVHALRAEGWNVAECPNLLKAVARLCSSPPAALLLDGDRLLESETAAEDLSSIAPEVALVVLLRSPRRIESADKRIILPADFTAIPQIIEEACEVRRRNLMATKLGDENRDLKDKLLQREKHLAKLDEAVERLAQSARTPGQLYETILEVFSDVTGAQRQSLMLLENGGDKKLKIVKARGVPANVVSETRQRVGQGVAGWVAQHGKPLFHKPPNVSSKTGCYHSNDFLSLPLKVGNRILGVKNLTERKEARPFDKFESETLTVLAEYAALCIHHMRKLEDAERLSLIDELTSLYNRRHFRDALRREIDRVERTGWKMALAMIDIDHFKVYNDTHGHPKGDEVLKKIAQILQDNVRSTDIVCRYGGEEFTVILPETGYQSGLPREKALQVVERLRTAVEEFQFDGQDTQPGHNLTISAGLAIYSEEANTAEELIALADKRLFKAKEAGRNCVRSNASAP